MPYNIKKQLSPKGFTILTNAMRPEECSIILQELNLPRNSVFEPLSLYLNESTNRREFCIPNQYFINIM